VFLGRLNLDDQVGFDGFFSAVGGGPPVTTPFTCVFKSEDGTDHYEIDGRFEFRPPRPPDPCQAEVSRVTAARGVLADIETELGDLQEELGHSSPAEKAGIIREIRRIRSKDIPPAAAALDAAEQALARCRAHQGLVVDGVVVADPRRFAPSG